MWENSVFIMQTTRKSVGRKVASSIAGLHATINSERAVMPLY